MAAALSWSPGPTYGQSRSVEAASGWRLELFGGLRASHGATSFTRFRTRKTGALLAYLAYYRERPHPRECLADLLWPDAGRDSARSSLCVALSWLRHQMLPSEAGAEPLVFSDPGLAWLNPAAGVTDVGEFERLLSEARLAAARPERVRLLAAAVHQYPGELLSGFYEDWIVPEQLRLADLFLQGLMQLVDLLERSGDLDQAVHYAWRALREDPLREESHCTLMRLYGGLGQPGMALRRYQELQEILLRECGRPPSEATRILAARLEQANTHRTGISPGKERSTRAMELAAPLSSGPICADSIPRTKSLKVVILHRRDSPSDTAQASRLEQGLRVGGLQVFVDRAETIDLDWARRLEVEIRAADIVAPLLTESSLASEILEQELRLAGEIAEHTGVPKIVPIRGCAARLLPPALSGLLGPLGGVHWNRERSALDIAREIATIAQNGRGAAAVNPQNKSSWAGVDPRTRDVGGGDEKRLVRAADDLLEEAVSRGDGIVLIKGAHQMGKSALLNRGIAATRLSGQRGALTDLQQFEAPDLADAGSLFMALAGSLSAQLGLGALLDQHWDPRRSPARNFSRFLRGELLSSSSAPVVWGIDGVDRLFGRPYADEVFALFRSWHNDRAASAASPWARLTLVLAYATEARLLIRDASISPFNVGTPIILEGFSFDEVADLNRRWGAPLQNSTEVARFLHLLGGHPHLSRLGLEWLATGSRRLADLEAQVLAESSPFSDHLQRILMLLTREVEILNAVRSVLRHRPQMDEETFCRLRSAGVLSGHCAQAARLPCVLYEDFFSCHIL